MAIMGTNLKVNDQYVAVKIIDTLNHENFTRHTVRLLEPLGDLEAGTVIEECYSFVKDSTARMYGIKQDIFPSFKHTRIA